MTHPAHLAWLIQPGHLVTGQEAANAVRILQEADVPDASWLRALQSLCTSCRGPFAVALARDICGKLPQVLLYRPRSFGRHRSADGRSQHTLTLT